MLNIFDSVIGKAGSRETSVLCKGIPFTKWKPPTVVLPSLGKAGNTIAASNFKEFNKVKISTAIFPLKTESIFL